MSIYFQEFPIFSSTWDNSNSLLMPQRTVPYSYGPAPVDSSAAHCNWTCWWSIACGSKAYGLPPAYGCGRGSGIKPMAEPLEICGTQLPWHEDSLGIFPKSGDFGKSFQSQKNTCLRNRRYGVPGYEPQALLHPKCNLFFVCCTVSSMLTGWAEKSRTETKRGKAAHVLTSLMVCLSLTCLNMLTHTFPMQSLYFNCYAGSQSR